MDEGADAWLAQNLGIKIDDFITGDNGMANYDPTDEYQKMPRATTAGPNRGMSNSGLTAGNK